MNESIHLANLPFDIIRNIVRATGIEFYESLRLISPKWNNAVTENICSNTNRPMLDFLRFSSDIFNVKIRLRLARRYLPYFGVDSWTIVVSSRSDEMVVVEKNFRENYLTTPNKWDIISTRFSRLFERCSRVEQLIFDGFFSNMNRITNALEDLTINKLCISSLGIFDWNFASDILELLKRLNSADRLLLSFQNLQWHLFRENLASFFAKAFEIVPNIDFEFSGRPSNKLLIERLLWDVRIDEIMGAQPSTLRANLVPGRHDNDVHIHIMMCAHRR